MNKLIQTNFVIYHGNCPDGMGSALSIKKFFDINSPNTELPSFYPAFYGHLPPDVTGKNVVICDFSYDYETTLNMINQANSLLIIDHHKSAQETLKNIPDENKIFDMTHSGAYLTWKKFNQNTDVPLLIRYIEDHDIWLHKMKNTHAVTSYIATLPFEFEDYEKLLDDNYLVKKVIKKALIFEEHDKYYINRALSKSATIEFVELQGQYYIIALLNTTILSSEIGNKLLDKYPFINFSVTYSMTHRHCGMSLRSANDRTDVSIVAKLLGGGGHRNASGIVASNNTFPANYICGIEVLEMLKSVTYKQINEKNILSFVSCNPEYTEPFKKWLLQSYLQISYNNNCEIVNYVQNYSAYQKRINNSVFYYDEAICE
jgi:uncharacterized protein